jgi:hypothetical protein
MAFAWAVVLLPLVDSGAVDATPADEDVTAGWVALLVFVGLILAVVLLGRSLVTQLRKAQAAADAGVYGDPPVTADGRPADDPADDPADHPSSS